MGSTDTSGTACTGCNQEVSLKTPGVVICPDCLVQRFCDEDCRADGLEEHQARCRVLAFRKLQALEKKVLAKGQTIHDWMDDVMDSLHKRGVLPACCTEKQLDELVILCHTVQSMRGEDFQVVKCKLLLLATRYAVLFERPTHVAERLIQESWKTIHSFPPADDEQGTMLWGSDPIFVLCINVGRLMAASSDPAMAVRFMQDIKPSLEVSLLTRSATENSSGPLVRLVLLYKWYSNWVKKCIPENLTRAEYRAHPKRKKVIDLLKYGLKVGKGHKDTLYIKTVAECGLELGMEHMSVEDTELALQVFQKCLKLPWNEYSARIAIQAVQCHILAGRDTQAGKWVDQFLTLEQHCPGHVGTLEQGVLFGLRGLICRRRGLHQDACTHVGKAETLIRKARQGKAEGGEEDEALLELSRDMLDCLEALKRVGVVAGVLQELGRTSIGRPIERLNHVQGLADKGQGEEARTELEDFSEKMGRWGVDNHYWRWRVKGITLWGMEMLQKWEGLVMQLVPEGEKRATILAKIEEMRGMEEAMKQKLLEDRRAQAMVEVREQVTGKPAAKDEGLVGKEALEPETGKPAAKDDDISQAADEATGEADETPGDRKPSKAAKKKRKKRQKKAAHAQEESSSQQEAEAELQAGLEESMASLDVTQEDDNASEEAEAGAGERETAEVAEKEECAICLNELGGEVGGEQEVLACGHVLHASCLKCWASKCESLCIDTTCPVCRGPVVETLSN